MIVPQPRRDDKRRRLIVTTGTAFVMLGSYTGLRSTPVPAFGSGSAVIRQLDQLFVERYSAPPAAEPEDGPAEIPENEDEGAVTLDHEVGSAIEDLARRFSEPDAPAGRPDPSRDARVTGIMSDPIDDRFSAVFGDKNYTTPIPTPGSGAANRTRAAGNIAGGGGGIALTTSRPGPARAPALDGAAGPVVVETAAGRAGERAVPATEVVIHEYQPDTFKRTDVALLTDWIQGHKAELPVGMKVHLRYQSSFLTASMPFQSDDRELELFLMFNPNLRELHIVLVEGDRSVYLIDRGFLEQSRSLREGSVRRLNGEIVAIDSHAGAASSDRAGEFYDIFLSWWEVAKTDAGP